MAVQTLLLFILVTIHACRAMARSEPGTFPLDGCSTDEIDFLFLYYDGYSTDDYNHQSDIAKQFAKDILGTTKATTRVIFAGVNDAFSENNSNVNVSSWHFSELKMFLDQSLGDVYTQRKKRNLNNNISVSIQRKLQFVQRLFSELGGVRDNSTHVAVIFMDGYFLSNEESRNVAHVVEQHQITNVYVFVVVLNVRNAQSVVYVRNTLLLGNGGVKNGVLLMAICSKCLEGWIHFDRGEHNGALSCYLLVNYQVQVDWNFAATKCKSQESALAQIETKEELDFLQTLIVAFLKDHKSLLFRSTDNTRLSAQVVIGLQRDTDSYAKRFRWSGSSNSETRPVVLDHWLPGKPSGGFSNKCGVWRFFWSEIDNRVNNSPGYGRGFTDRWFDVTCTDKINTLSLCEMSLPSRIDEKNVVKINAARNDSFMKALSYGNLIIHEENIVSVSANIARLDFVEVLKQGKLELFPVFDCGIDVPDPRYISYNYVCDSLDHCSNRRDELFCVDQSLRTRDKDNFANKCSGILCCDGSCLPLQWVGDGVVDCNVCMYKSENEVNDESDVVVNSLKTNESCALFCDNKCIDFSKLNDGREDCKGADKSLDETIGKLKTTYTCSTVSGHRVWAPRCVYVKDRFGAVLGCRDMSHLEECTNFECPEGYLKCPNAYCIPQHYVLDETVDCPSGEDENQYAIAPCTGNFACWNSKMCLHPDQVCDGHPDCPYQDDEVDCHVRCVGGLRCIAGTATVSNHTGTIATQTHFEINNYIDIGVRYLDLSGIDLSTKSFFFLKYLTNLTVVIFSRCNIHSQDLTFLYYSHRWQDLDLSYNKLQTMHNIKNRVTSLENIRLWNLSYNEQLFDVYDHKLQFLETLDLSHTSLSFLDTFFLLSFPRLKHLNLSFTKINNIPTNTFHHKLTLHTLDLRGLFINGLYKDVFNGLAINQDLYTDSFELCCPQIRGANIPSHTCHAPDNPISSCFHLIGTSVQRVLLWLVAVLAVLGNMIVISYRVICNRSVLWTRCSLFVTNLGVSDFIMGVYLFIIAGADYYYRDVYVLYDKSWRESVVCKLAGFLATFSSEASTFIVFLITMDRFFVMKFPFGQVKFSKISKIVALSLSWIIGFLLALTPIVFRFQIYSSNAMCLALPLTTERFNGWEFSFAVFIVLNFSLFLLIVYGQRVIFQGISENKTWVAARRWEDITVAKQLCLVALTNFLCWFPIGLMGLLSLGGHMISSDVYAWTIVIVLPINSAANPLLYTFSAIMAKWERFTFRKTKTVLSSTELVALHHQ